MAIKAARCVTGAKELMIGGQTTKIDPQRPPRPRVARPAVVARIDKIVVDLAARQLALRASTNPVELVAESRHSQKVSSRMCCTKRTGSTSVWSP